MTITLPTEQEGYLLQLVASGRFVSLQAAITEAVRRLKEEDSWQYLNPEPLTDVEAEQVYKPDPEWERLERTLAGRARPEV